MRAYCLNIYDEHDQHQGDVWLCSPYPVRPGRELILHPDMPGAVGLSESNVRQLREACDTFLREQEAADV